jgi:hypothetical protein
MARKPDLDPAQALRELDGSSELLAGYVLRGDELYFTTRARDTIVEKAREAGYEVCRHDVKESTFDAAVLLDDLAGGALFASSRLVLIANPEAQLKKDAPLERAIASFLAGGRGSVVLVSSGLRADNRTVKAIVKAGGRLLSFRKLYDKPPPWQPHADPRNAELPQWLRARARELSVELSGEGALLLIAAVGNHLFALEDRLSELRLAGEQSFFEQLQGDGAGSPFVAATEVCRGNASAGLFQIETLFRSGQRGRDGKRELAPKALREVLFNALRSKLRGGLAGAVALSGGAGPDEAAAAAGVPNFPAAKREFAEMVRLRSVRDWRRMSDDLARLERRARMSRSVDVNDFALFALRWKKRREHRALAR